MLGRTICYISPSSENNRNSEGAFIKLSDGRIMFAYSRYGGGGFSDGAYSDIYAVISDDNGDSFSSPQVLLTAKELGADNIMSVSLMNMQNGDIGMFFLRKDENRYGRMMLTRSSDNGESWSRPICCTDEASYFVVNNDRVIRTSDGRLLFPAACYHTEKAKEGSLEPEIRSSELRIYASSDDGESWECISKGITIPYSRGCTTGVQEPGVIELGDSKLLCWIRTNSGRQYECFSDDNGVSWTQPLPSIFTSPESPMSMKRLKDGSIAAVWNPIPFYNGRQCISEGKPLPRTPIVIALSHDNTETFTDYTVIESDPTYGYCYTAIFELDDGDILLGYCAGNRKYHGGQLNQIEIRKISAAELKNIGGTFPLKEMY